MANNIVNPFQSNTAPLGVGNVFVKISTNSPAKDVTFTPSAPSSFTTSANTQQMANVISALTAILALSNANNITTFSAQDILSMSNTVAMFTANVNSPGSYTYDQQQLQDMIISTSAIQRIANTGVLVTQQDIMNNPNSQISLIGTAQVETPFFPSGAQTVICNDQYFICEAPGTGGFFWSNTANGADWSVLNTADMETFSDQPIAMDQFSGQVIAFGIQSIEFFTDTGQYPIPYVATQGTTQNYGLAAVFSRAAFQNSIAFLGTAKTGQAHVYILNGYVPEIISTTDIDQIINSFEVINDALGYAFDYNGHQFYFIQFPTAGRAFLFDGTTEFWSEWQSGLNEFSRHLSSLAVTFNSSVLVSDYASGNIYLLDQNALTDNGFLIRREFVSRDIRLNGNEFSISELTLDVSTGSGQQTGIATNPKILMQYSIDDGNNWSEPRPMQLGKVGEYFTKCTWYRIGAPHARHYVFRFIVTDPVPLNIVNGYAVLIPGTETSQ